MTIVIGPLSVSVLLAGCGGGGGSSNSGGGGLTGPDPTTLALSATTPDGLMATLSQPQATVKVGSTVTYTVTLTNAGSTPVSIQTGDQAGTDQPLVPVSFTVTDSAGKSVYTNPAPAASQTVTLQPTQYLTETLTLTNVFQHTDRYSATATFQTGSSPTTLGPLVLTAR
jgi:uncharacterized repeat protein (TIGR01451 family)